MSRGELQIHMIIKNILLRVQIRDVLTKWPKITLKMFYFSCKNWKLSNKQRRCIKLDTLNISTFYAYDSKRDSPPLKDNPIGCLYSQVIMTHSYHFIVRRWG